LSMGKTGPRLMSGDGLRPVIGFIEVAQFSANDPDRERVPAIIGRAGDCAPELTPRVGAAASRL
jgi:hypothetical protein